MEDFLYRQTDKGLTAELQAQAHKGSHGRGGPEPGALKEATNNMLYVRGNNLLIWLAKRKLKQSFWHI